MRARLLIISLHHAERPITKKDHAKHPATASFSQQLNTFFAIRTHPVEIVLRHSDDTCHIGECTSDCDFVADFTCKSKCLFCDCVGCFGIAQQRFAHSNRAECSSQHTLVSKL